MIGNKKMIIVVRVIHGVITFIFLSCIFYIYYSGITNRIGWITYLAIGLIVVEGIVVSLNKGNCPLGPIHHKYGDDKAFFELILPKRTAKMAVPVLGIIAAVGILLVFL